MIGPGSDKNMQIAVSASFRFSAQLPSSEIHHATLPSLKNNLVTCRSKSFYTLACLDPRGPFVLLPLVNLSARNENLDPLYTGMYAT